MLPPSGPFTDTGNNTHTNKLGAGTQSRTPLGLAGTNYLSHHSRSQGSALAGYWSWEQEPAIESRHSITGCGHLNQPLNASPYAFLSVHFSVDVADHLLVLT